MSSISDVLSRCIEGFQPVPDMTIRVPEIGSLQHRAYTPEVRAVNEEARTITFIASNETTDRYGDIIRVNGWKLDNYKRNPIFLWSHKSDQPPIGKTISISTESNPPSLVQVVEFADAKTYQFADTIFQLYKNGFLRAVSVGFKPLAQPNIIRDDSGMMTGLEFTSQELLELSAVPIPANPDARARAITEGVVTADDAERIFRPAEQRSVEPATALDAGQLRTLLQDISVEQLNLSLMRLEALTLLSSIERGKRNQGSEELTSLEQLLTGCPESVTSLDQLDQVLRGEL